MELYDQTPIDVDRIARYLHKPVHLYELSLTTIGASQIALIRCTGELLLVVQGSGILFEQFHGIKIDSYKLCPADHENRLILNRYLPHTAPTRLTISSIPVLLVCTLWQAKRAAFEACRDPELFCLLECGSEEEVDEACWAAFSQRYTGRWGVLGSSAEGFRKLDLASHADRTIAHLSTEEQQKRYALLSQQERMLFEELYGERLFTIADQTMRFERRELARLVLIWKDAIAWAVSEAKRYETFVLLDSLPTPTEPKELVFLLSELQRRKLGTLAIAPRLPGDFRPSAEYRGEVRVLEEALDMLTLVARHFGVRLLVRNLDYKDCLLPILGKRTWVGFEYLQWSEAMRLCAEREPGLFQVLVQEARLKSAFEKRYLQMPLNLSQEGPLDGEGLRQLLVIRGRHDRLSTLLEQEEARYCSLLCARIKEHLAYTL